MKRNIVKFTVVAIVMIFGVLGIWSGHLPGAWAASATSNKAQTYLESGDAYLDLGLPEKAIDSYTKALQINPQCAEAYCARGFAYGTIGQLDQAIADFSEALRINPKLIVAYYNRGFIYEKKGQMDQALADANAALQINPQYTDGWFLKGYSCEKLSRNPEAIEAYRQFLHCTSNTTDPKQIEYVKQRIAALGGKDGEVMTEQR